MDQNFTTAMAGVLGSVSGASAAIATTWISQKNQTVRERAKSETRKREILYGDFITEASHLVADAVLTAAEECCDRVVDLYAKPNRTMAEIFTTLHGGEFEFLKNFSAACRVELRRYSTYRCVMSPF